MRMNKTQNDRPINDTKTKVNNQWIVAKKFKYL